MEQYENSLLATFTAASNSVRKEAEAFLSSVAGQPGFAQWLVATFSPQAAASNPHLALAAALYLKNVLPNHWGPSANGAQLTAPWLDNDKTAVKAGLMEALFAAPNELLRENLAVTLSAIVQVDWPRAWPELVPGVVGVLSGAKADDPAFDAALEGALLAFRAMLDKYSAFAMGPSKVLNNLLSAVLPAAGQVWEPMLARISAVYGSAPAAISPDAEAAVSGPLRVTRLLVKVWFESIAYRAPAVVVSEDPSFALANAWMNAVDAAAQAVPAPTNDHTKDLAWKLRKSIVSGFQVAFEQWGNPATVKSSKNRPFAEMFAANYFPSRAQDILGLLTRAVSGGFVPKTTVVKSLWTLKTAVVLGGPWSQILAPNLEQLFGGVLFPLACYSQEDAEEMASNPVEYVNYALSYAAEGEMAAHNAGDVVASMVRFRTSQTLRPVMDFLLGVMNRVEELIESPQAQTLEGAGCMLIMLHPVFTTHSDDYGAVLRGLFTGPFVRMTQSSNVFVRARGLLAIASFAGSRVIQPEDVGGALQAAIDNMGGSGHPLVKVCASRALSALLRSGHATMLTDTHVQTILTELFTTLTEFGNEHVVRTLSVLTSKYPRQVCTCAADVASRLTNMYETQVARDNAAKAKAEIDMNSGGGLTFDFTDDDDEEHLPTFEILRAAVTLVNAVSEHMPEILRMLEEQMFPMLISGLGDAEHVGGVLHIVTVFTSQTKTISPTMWKFYDAMLVAWDASPDFSDSFVYPLDNYLDKGRDMVCGQRASSIPMLMSLAMKGFQNVEGNLLADSDLRTGSSVMELMLQFLGASPAVEQALPTMLSAVAGVWSDEYHTATKVMLLTVFANALIYNAGLTLRITEEAGITARMFTLLMNNAENFSRVYDMRLLTFAILSLWSGSLTELPQIVQDATPNLLSALVTLEDAIPAARAVIAAKEADKANGGGIVKVTDGPFGDGWGDDDSDDSDEDEWGDDGDPGQFLMRATDQDEWNPNDDLGPDGTVGHWQDFGEDGGYHDDEKIEDLDAGGFGSFMGAPGDEDEEGDWEDADGEEMDPETFFAKMIARQAQERRKEEADQDVVLKEDASRITPLDSLDEVSMFAQTIQRQLEADQRFQAAVNSLPDELRASVDGLFQEAARRQGL